ncbi:primase-helicase family protein [Parasphingorhabdus sp.]|uniref:primase-helicase family protein n=1 Tax=Parasphingorhabdus sp. TaxID=2709688 RepID=UPI00359361B8
MNDYDIPKPAMPVNDPPPLDCSGEYLTHIEQKQWFKGCVLIGPENRIFDSKGLKYDPGAFNSTYGGKKFMIDANGRLTDDAWKAATRSTLWTVPKVDGTTFLPSLPTGQVTTDELGRNYVNTYIPAKIESIVGDPSPFLRHMEMIIPDASDREIFYAYLAHNAKYPGDKIPWAPLIQSTEGVGKNVIKYAMTHVMGDHYTYPPNAKELASGGSKFNAWIRGRLFFICDEIKTDEKRDLVEVLKPMISEEKMEVQSKGIDQRKDDNPANWLFFSNHKDAIPVDKNGRRFAIFYSAIQSKEDLQKAGMNDAYFNDLYDQWLGPRSHKFGLKIIANFLLTYPIERGAIPMRAPETSSMAEAMIQSRGWLAQLIAEAVDDSLPGFCGGWIATVAVKRLLVKAGRKPVENKTMSVALSELGYHKIGRATRPYFQDDKDIRSTLWHIDPNAMIENYSRSQGYE